MNQHLDNFWAKVEKQGNGCWNWKGFITTSGYGQFQVKGEHVLAHRFVWDTYYGRISEGMVIDHLCKNRICVNPDHLEMVTQRTNVMRTDSPTAINARKTHCPKGHPLEGDNLTKWSLKHGSRQCKTCFNEWQHQRYLRLKVKVMHKEEMAKITELITAINALTDAITVKRKEGGE